MGKKGRKKWRLEVFLIFLAVGGHFRPFETLRFAVTFQTVPIPSRTELCSLIFGHFFGFLILEKIMYYYSNKRRYHPPVGFQVFRFLGISGLRDFSGRILRKNSVPNDPFLWRLLPPCPANLVRKIFCSKFGEFQGAVFPVPGY